YGRTEFIPFYGHGLFGFYNPGIVAGEEILKLPAAFGADHIFNLPVEQLVIGRSLDTAEDADAFGKAWIDHSTEEVGQAWLLGGFIMHKQIIDADAIAQRHDLWVQAVQPDALVAIFAEDERLTMLQIKRVVGLDALVGGVLEDAVVENLAVLIDLDER